MPRPKSRSLGTRRKGKKQSPNTLADEDKTSGGGADEKEKKRRRKRGADSGGGGGGMLPVYKSGPDSSLPPPLGFRRPVGFGACAIGHAIAARPRDGCLYRALQYNAQYSKSGCGPKRYDKRMRL